MTGTTTTTTKAAIDVKGLGKEFATIFGSELRGVLEGAEEDIQAYAAEMAESFARNVAAGREHMTAELRGQLRALAEVQRIRANDAAWDIVERLATVAMRTAASAFSLAVVAGNGKGGAAAKG